MGKRDLYEDGCVDGAAYEARGREFESLRAYHPYENAWLKSLIIIIRLLAFEVCLGYS